jgi:tetratricopeptide (TPR) repeat protein
MTRDNLLFAIIGILFGFIVGFIFASNLLQKEANVAPSARTQALPPDHPSVGDAGAPAGGAGGGGMQADVQAALTTARNEPTNFEAQLKAAELYYRIQRYDDSIAYLLKANQLKPDDPETAGNLGMVNMDAGHYESAETWYKAAVTKKPDDVRFLDGYCNVLLQLSKTKEAEEAIGKLAKLDPTNQDLATFRERLATLKSGGKAK